MAIVVPRLGAAAASGPGRRPGRAAPLRRRAGAQPRGRGAARASWPRCRSPRATSSSARCCCSARPSRRPDALEFLHVAAVACLTEVAVEEARLEVEQNLRGSFLEELRGRDDLEADEVLRRAARLGCDLSRGAVALCAELSSDRPRHVVATIAGEHPGALAQHMDGGGGSGRVYALLPAVGGADAAATLTAARRLAARLQRHGTVGRVVVLRRRRRSRPRDPGGRAGARRPAPLGRPDRRGHRHRHLPAAVPRARVAPRGGALVLRGHGRAARRLRRAVLDRPRGHARAPTWSATAT